MQIFSYNWRMNTGFDWNIEKNQQLIRQRGMSFERIVSGIQQGYLVDVLEHPNQDRYPGQLIYVVDIDEYMHLVPFVMQADGTRFLKTIIPSRKATREYRRRRTS
ncbi:MAG: BrnT family toxin [Chloroflexi bacterium]|nr:BrnT family toxin [Chloroflexota bacterium]